MRRRWLTIDGFRVLKGGALYRWLIRTKNARHGWYKHHRKPPPVPKPQPIVNPTVPIEGVDYVSGPSPAELKAAGKKFVCRYLSTSGNPKNVTAAEVSRLHAAGLGVVLVFETTGTTFWGSSPAGKRDAQLALKQADALGVPSSVPIYFAIDSDPRGHEAQIVSYIKGAASVLGKNRTGVYGGYAAVAACVKAGACDWFWQTYAWSAGAWSKARHLEQYDNGVHIAGHSVDLDRALRLKYGA